MSAHGRDGTTEPRWSPTFSRFRFCGRLSCWLDRALGIYPWGGNCATGHAPKEFAAGDYP